MQEKVNEIKKVCIDKLYRLVVVDNKIDCLSSLCKILEIISVLGE